MKQQEDKLQPVCMEVQLFRVPTKIPNVFSYLILIGTCIVSVEASIGDQSMSIRLWR